jgi:hypothetical protein
MKSLISCVIKLLLALVALDAPAQWPKDARITQQNVDGETAKRTVSLFRGCDDGSGSIVNFVFEFPQFRGRSSEVRVVNRAIEGYFSVGEELQDCPLVVRPEGAVRDSVSIYCEVISRHGALRSLECRRSANVQQAAPSGYVDYLNFDLTLGQRMRTADLITDLPEFTRLVRAQMLSDYPDVFSETDQEWFDQTVVNMVRSCGFNDKEIVCSTLVGTRAIYDVAIPIATVLNLLPSRYFSHRNGRHD